MGPYDIFRLVIEVNSGGAEFEYIERLNDHVPPTTIPRVKMTFTDPEPPRTMPSFAETHYLIEAMATIPVLIIEEGVFKEIILVLEVNDVDVASGLISIIDAAAGLSRAHSNISVSW